LANYLNNIQKEMGGKEKKWRPEKSPGQAGGPEGGNFSRFFLSLKGGPGGQFSLSPGKKPVHSGGPVLRWKQLSHPQARNQIKYTFFFSKYSYII
jgi:hypothetical protein